MFKQFLFVWALILGLCTVLSAQKLLPPFDRFSDNDTSYLTLTDGTQLEGKIDDIDRKKGLIEEITIKDFAGKKHKLAADKIESMYLPASGFSKFANTYSFLHDAQQWDNKKLDRGKIAEGYAYFERSTVKIKKTERVLLLQLLNPSFSDKIRVYYDPFAAETTSFGVGGVTVAGGDDKSYYIKKGDEIAFKLEKGDYSDEFARLFDGCKQVLRAGAKKAVWADFAEHVYNHSHNCGK